MKIQGIYNFLTTADEETLDNFIFDIKDFYIQINPLSIIVDKSTVIINLLLVDSSDLKFPITLKILFDQNDITYDSLIDNGVIGIFKRHIRKFKIKNI